MAIKFYADTHKYISADSSEKIDWISVTRLIHYFKEAFDEMKMSHLCSVGKNPKYFGKSPEEIRKIWKDENLRAVTLGSWYHDEREKAIINCDTITRNNVELRIINPLYDNNVKLAPDQSLSEGIYPEHLVYLKSFGICGQGDRIEVIGSFINLYEYKTNKEIKTEGFKGKDGRTKRMLPPLSHLDDCNFNDYALQLSIYMFIMLKHNPNLNTGVMQIEHIEFEVEKRNSFGYPVSKLDSLGNPIVKKVTPYQVPYLRKEVLSMFKYLENNREKILGHVH